MSRTDLNEQRRIRMGKERLISFISGKEPYPFHMQGQSDRRVEEDQCVDEMLVVGGSVQVSL